MVVTIVAVLALEESKALELVAELPIGAKLNDAVTKVLSKDTACGK